MKNENLSSFGFADAFARRKSSRSALARPKKLHASLLTLLIFHFSLFTFHSSTLPKNAKRRTFTVLTYNCENAFDTLDTPGHSDESFLPQGEYHWSRWRYFRKLQRMAQVILAADTLKPLDIAILQEVETDTVLQHLLHRTQLAGMGYDYVMTDSRDERGIDVAIVYSPFTFQPLGHQTIGLSDTFLRTHNVSPTRDALHLWGLVYGGRDTLDILAVHMPSKLGGGEATRKRKEMTRLLETYVDSLLHHRRQPYIVMAGDFNDAPRRGVSGLTNLMQRKRGGSYKYQGRWEWIDQMQVSPLLEPFGSLHLLDLPYLLEDDTTWGGKKPFRTYLGPYYHGGYSDHLPVTLTLDW